MLSSSSSSQIPDLTSKSQFGNAWGSERLVSKEGWILDAQNRVVILHGINVSGGTKMPFYTASAAVHAPSQYVGYFASSLPEPEFFGAEPRPPFSTTSSSSSSSSPPSTKKPISVKEAKAAVAKAASEAETNGTKDKGAIPGVVYSHIDDHFYNHREVSFVNRPFTLQDAELHFERLARWGCQCLRLLIPWEALEHAGPPGWTLELAGLDITKFDATGAAIKQNTHHDKENYPKMIWATNGIKLAAATMYTLFFAGQIFAPKTMVPLSTTVLSHLRTVHSSVVADEAYRRGLPNGARAPSPVQNLTPIPKVDQDFVERGQVNIQHYLQAHFIEAFAHLTQRIREDDSKTIRARSGPGLIEAGTVMGYDTMNEPAPGYLNHPDLTKLLELADLQVGTCPTPFQGMELAQGRTVKCEVWETGALGPRKKRTIKVNQEKVNLWKRPYWRSRQQTNNQQQGSNTIIDGEPIIPPARPLPAYYSETSTFDDVSQLGITEPQADDDNNSRIKRMPLASPMTLTASPANYSTKDALATPPSKLAESHISKTLWPEPAGYSDYCLWAEHKVWDPRTGKLLKPNYFQRIPTQGYIPSPFQPGKEVEWKHDFWLPFVNTFSLRLRQQDSRLIIFVEPPINEAPPMFRLKKVLVEGAEDGLKNMLRSVISWKSRKTFPNQHTTAILRQSASTRATQSADGRGNSDDNNNKNRQNDYKGKGSFGTTDDLYESACQQPRLDPMGDVSENIIVAPHFYDGYTNITRDFVPFTLDFMGYKRGIYSSVLGALKFGWSGVGQAWKDQVKGIQSDIRLAMGPQHGILMGETGLPIDLHNKTSFKSRHGHPKQSFAMRLLLDAMDASMLSFTLWNYCADNSNQWGDRWNGEDFSVWCEPENGFIEPEFTHTTAVAAVPNMASPIPIARHDSGILATTNNKTLEQQLVPISKVNNPSWSPNVALTEIAAEMGSGLESVGCHEGFIWWCCLPTTNVWTKRTAPKRMVAVSVEPKFSGFSAEDAQVIEANTSNNNEKPKPLATLTTWQDLLPLSLQIERSRIEYYGGLRVGESFLRAYPLAIWGEPLLYRFEPGIPISDKGVHCSMKARKQKTKDVQSWENHFLMLLTLSCDRRPKRRGDGQSNCEQSWNYGQLQEPSHEQEIASTGGSGDNRTHKATTSPSTDVFLPRFHFALDSTVNEDHFESLNHIKELQEDLCRRQQSRYVCSSSNSATAHSVSRSSKDKGRWHRLDIRVSDGHFKLGPARQILQYWTSPQPQFNSNDNLASTAEFFEVIETRIRGLFALGWDGLEGITTVVEQEWIKRIWKEIQRDDAEAGYSGYPCLWSFSKRMGRTVELEEEKKLKYKERQLRWRDRIGLPSEGATYCGTCGQLDVMHVHGVSVRLQMWSGYRGLVEHVET
ncbi:hypothetical protein BX616_003474 [Lobosporangium transversale]|nr:hypothetical protein BX616_003474 [Lobosporangium transversale]